MKNISVLILAALVLMLATDAYSVPAFRARSSQGEIVLRLLDAKCSNEKVMAHIKTKVRAEYQNEFRDGKLSWHDGKDYATCWIAMDGVVFSIDEEGSPLNPVPYRSFVEEGV